MVAETETRVAPRFGKRLAAAPAADDAHVEPAPARRRWFSPLTVRILALNIPALGILLGGALFLGQYREGLVEAKIESLRAEGAIIAAALGESAVPNDGPNFER